MGTEAKSDSELLAEFVQSGQGAPFAEIVHRYQGLVFGVCRRVLGQFQDAEDAAQAVFVTLAHKAGSLQGRPSIAGWLHRVAWHVALRAREAAGLRKTHEREAAAMIELSGNPDYQWEDLRPILDHEIDALPEKYRLPLVLHYLQGQTKEETARLLGQKSGTVSTWLDRGRDMLRERLARRGLTITGALLAALLIENATAPAALSATAAEATVEAAVRIAAGDLTAGGAVSAHAAALAQGALKALAIAKLKLIAASAAAVVTVCTVLGVGAYQAIKPATIADTGGGVVVAVAALDRLDAEAIAPAEEFAWQPAGLVAVAGEHLGRHTGVVTTVAFHGDGKLAASGGPGTPIRLWDAQARRLKHVVPVDGNVVTLAISKDGKRLACGTSAGGVAVWGLDPAGPPRRLLSFTATSSAVHSVAFSPLDSQRLAVGTGDGSVQVWDLSSKEAKSLAMLSAHEGAVRSVAYSTDGKTLASGSDDTTVQLWDMTLREPVEKARLEGHTAPVLSVAFAVNGMVASGSDDATVRLWHPQGVPAKAQHVLQAQVGKVHAVTFHPDGTTLAVAGTDRRICLWQVARSGNEPLRLGVNFEGHLGPIFALAFGGPDGKLLVSGSADCSARFWQLQDFKPLDRTGTIGHLTSVHAATFTADGRHLATSSGDATIRMWQMDGTAPQEVLVLKDNPDMTALAFAPDGRTVFAVSHTGQGVVKQFNVADGKELRRFSLDLKNQGICVALSPDCRRVLIGCRDRTLRLWDIEESGKEVARLTGHDAPITTIAFSPDGRRALSGAGQAGKTGPIDCTVRLWDLVAKKQVCIVGTHPNPVRHRVLFSADGRRAFSASNDALIKQWDVSHSSPRELEPLKDHRALLLAALSSDSKHLAAWRPPGGLILWNVAAGSKSQEWSFPERVSCISFAADSRHLAVGLGTGVVYIVRLERGE